MPPLARLAALPVLLAACASQEEFDWQADLARHDGRMTWWRDARVGLLVHWGLFATPDGDGDTDPAEGPRPTAPIPLEESEALAARFDPTGFDADEWALMARGAGMGYLVVTTKHHDGFALFDSALSDYDVMATPFGRDITAELAAACRREGLRIGWYHSIMDWHHPDSLPRRDGQPPPAAEVDYARYVEYLRGQVSELLTNYGKIDLMWFDWEQEDTWDHDSGQALYVLCRTLQPDLIVNDRVEKGRALGDFATSGDGGADPGLARADWESSTTLNRHRGWKAADEDWKSAADLIRTLVDVASRGGNLLLQVGPRPDGTFPPAAVERLAALGSWMEVHGEAIRGTTAARLPLPPWGRTTLARRRGRTTLYLLVFDWPADGVLEVPGLASEPRAARLLGRPGAGISTRTGAQGVRVTLLEGAPDPVCSVIALELVGPPRRVPSR